MDITTTEFYEIINSTDTLVIAAFGAEWSGSASMLRNLLNEVVGNYHSSLELIWTDIEENQDLANEWGISRVPTILIFKNGEVVDHFTGLLAKNKVKERLDLLIN